MIDMCEGTVQFPGATAWVNTVAPRWTSRSNSGVGAERGSPREATLAQRTQSSTTVTRFGGRDGSAGSKAPVDDPLPVGG